MFRSCQLLARPIDEPNSLLKDHLIAVSRNSQAILSQATIEWDLQTEPNVLQDLCMLIGGGHDVGKATRYFQEYVRRKRVDRVLRAHSPLSSFYVYTVFPTVLGEDGAKILRWLSLAVVLHHHGALASPPQTFLTLQDWFANKIQIQINSVDKSARDELNLILQKMSLPPFPDFQEIEQQSKKMRSDFKAITEYCLKKRDLTLFYLSNLLFSILIDADRMDAAGIKPPLRKELNAEIIKQHAEQISKECECKELLDPARLHMRRRLFSEIAQKAKRVPLDKRIYSLTAPTGCGKTLAGLYFALVLRERLQTAKGFCPRIIYVAPFLSILDQNFEVFRKALRIPKEAKQTEILLQHHHLSELSYKVFQDVGAETYSSLESEILIEGWNAEVVVTTFVQFLNTILGARASQLRKLHNLIGSIVILDEVQCIPAKWWFLIRESLKFLAQKFKMYFILMTATQPLIFDTSEVEELVENQEYYFEKNYVRLKVGPKVSIGEFAKKVAEKIRNEKKSVMILMNTIDSAIYLYNVLVKSLPNSIQLEYLSAELLPIHRARKLDSINEKLCAAEPLVLVTTQVVEAGVNLDFDGVIRDIGPVDSIIQAAGRCNREGKKNPSESFIEIFEIYDEKGTFCRRIYGDFAIEKTHNALRRWTFGENFSELAKLFYQETRKGLSDEKSRRILEGLGRLDYEKLREFVIIEETPRCSVFVEWDSRAMELWKKYESLSSRMNCKRRHEKFLEIKKELYKYLINVPEKYVGGIPQNAGFWYISHDQVEKFYDKHTGFKRKLPSSVI